MNLSFAHLRSAIDRQSAISLLQFLPAADEVDDFDFVALFDHGRVVRDLLTTARFSSTATRRESMSTRNSADGQWRGELRAYHRLA
jgi:hypothetical protein